ncbi:MAG: DUF4154 domain-containing protein [Bacteroidales bacterium]|nr:DUF4154 domain-containing protein [Bacteroidales bacterium]MBN2750749.1 DUF4154 domain-containing protein [Bacteroidales bacterium]
MQKKYSLLVLTFLIFGIRILVSAQEYSDAKLKAAYINQFAQQITWPNESLLDTFRIKVISNKTELHTELLNLFSTRRIKNRAVSIERDEYFQQRTGIRFPNIIVIEGYDAEIANDIFTKVESSPILVVSEIPENKDKAMINFYYADEQKQQLTFEINRYIIEIKQGLQVQPKLLLLGGSRTDAANLFQQQETQLQDERLRALRLQEEIKQQTLTIENQQREIILQQKSIKEQEQTIANQQAYLEAQQKALDSLTSEIAKQNVLLIRNLSILKSHRNEIKEQQDRIEAQAKQMERRNDVLRELNNDIVKQQKRIEEQKGILNQQQQQIKTKNEQLILSLTTIFLALLSAFFIFKGYRNKVKINRQLAEKNEAIARKNTEIEQQKEEIQLQSELLAEHNHRLEDMVEQRTKEYQIAKEKAEESDRLKSAFLANMSHEIRTPLNAIVGFTQLILEEPHLTQAGKDNVDIVTRSSFDLLRLIDDILDLAKIEAEQLVLYPKTVNLNDELNLIYRIHRRSLDDQDKANKVSLKLQYPDNEGEVFLRVDIRRLQQVLNNLISNSIKFTTEGSISFGYSLNAGFAQFFVSDTGMGIPKEQHCYLFQRFSKINNCPDKFHSGTGLGLAISKGLVEQLGGKIWFDSDEGKGSTFYFSIPLKTGNAPLKQQNEATEGLSYKGKTAVVAEDNENSALLLKVLLSDLGFKVVLASNGREAIKSIETLNGCDVAFLDIQMPILDGYATFTEMRNKGLNFPIIAQTAFAMEQDMQRIAEHGFNGFISKPILKENVVAELHKVLGQGKTD